MNEKRYGGYTMQTILSKCSDDDAYTPGAAIILDLIAENDRLRQAMEWISVEDRLPERSSEDVITCIHYGNRHFAYEYENYYLPDTNEWANPLHKWTHWTKAILPPEVD